MENNNSKEETPESKKRLQDLLGVDSDQLIAKVSKYMELYRKIKLLQFPLTADLKNEMKELFEKQYPHIKPYIQIWHVNWVFEAMDMVANSLSIYLVYFFEKVQKGENHKEKCSNYDQLVKLFTKPYEARKTVIENEKLHLNAEQLMIYEQVIEEKYQEDLVGFEVLNRQRNEFLNMVYKQVQKYFGDQFDLLTPDQMTHFDILVGLGYEDYFDDCKELNYFLIEKNMQEYPGLNYHHFLLKEYENYREVSA